MNIFNDINMIFNFRRESFRSLIQLVRAHQCPYFYLCANKFTCMIRAAGIGGFQQIHAVLSPTTAGFRRLLQKDGKVMVYHGNV